VHGPFKSGADLLAVEKDCCYMVVKAAVEAEVLAVFFMERVRIVEKLYGIPASMPAL
jgi:hypothetical protein